MSRVGLRRFICDSCYRRDRILFSMLKFCVPGIRRSEALVREEEDGASEVGSQRRFVIIARENSVLPGQQVGVAAGEVVPVGDARIGGARIDGLRVDGGSACHALTDDEKVSVRDGLVVELRLTAGSCVALQGGGKFI